MRNKSIKTIRIIISIIILIGVLAACKKETTKVVQPDSTLGAEQDLIPEADTSKVKFSHEQGFWAKFPFYLLRL